jgi:hypothetical protein
MSLDVADVDHDGDVDIVVGEHDESDPSVGRVIIYRNMGAGSLWSEWEIDSGLEHHDGTQFVDIDKDGDLDILSIGWFHEQVVVYENRTIKATGSRVTDGLQALFLFDQGEGGTISDISAVREPLTLRLQDPASTSWTSSGLIIKSPTIIASDTPATEMVGACQDTNEITIEAWIRPSDTTQDGPARIVSLSSDTHNRNFTLGQQGTRYDTRLRTTDTGDNGSSPSLAAGTVVTAPTHTVYTRDIRGTASFYINGREVGSRSDIGGDFSVWNPSFRLALGNELTGDRPWLGEFFLVALYCRALSPLEVGHNFNAGLVTSRVSTGVLPVAGEAADSPAAGPEDNETGYNEFDAINSVFDLIARILIRLAPFFKP